MSPKLSFIFSTKEQLSKVGMINIRIEDDVIQNIPSVRNQRLHFDEELKPSSHVNKLTSVSFNMIQNLVRICHQLDIEMTKTLLQALVLSHLIVTAGC